MIFWLGDLNYRIQSSPTLTVELIKYNANTYQLSALLQHDQLLLEMKHNNAFLAFTEAPIDFKPSYKYDPNTDDWDSR